MRAHVVRVGPQGHAIELFVSEPQAMVAVADEVEVLTLDNLAALEARKPQVDAEVIARTQGALIGWQNADEFDTEELQEHGDVLRDATRALLAAVEAVPPDEERLTEPPTKHRFAEWCGENFAAIWYEFSLLRNELGLPQPECDEEASGSEPAPEGERVLVPAEKLEALEQAAGKELSRDASLYVTAQELQQAIRAILPYIRPAPQGERLTEEHSRALRDALAGYQCYPEWQNAADHLAQTVSDVLCAVVPGYAEGCLPPAPKPPAPDEERLTEEECWATLREAITQAADAHGDTPSNLILEWTGRDWVATFEAGTSSRGIGRHATDPIAACRELAFRAVLPYLRPAPAPTPDFASMSADDLRAWLDERGRLYEGRATGEEVLFHAWFGGGGAVGAGYGSTREAALLAFCQKVAAEEAS